MSSSSAPRNKVQQRVQVQGWCWIVLGTATELGTLEPSQCFGVPLDFPSVAWAQSRSKCPCYCRDTLGQNKVDVLGRIPPTCAVQALAAIWWLLRPGVLCGSVGDPTLCREALAWCGLQDPVSIFQKLLHLLSGGPFPLAFFLG